MPSNGNEQSNAPAWLSSARRRLFVDTQFPDWSRPGQSGGAVSELRDVATRFDPEAIVSAAADAGAQVIVAFAKCQFGNFYYDTAIGHKHAGLGDLDLLGEVVSLAHARDIRVVAYYSNRWDVEAARAHPEWMARDAAGNASYDRWPDLCLLSPYRDLVTSHLTELTSGYEIDGIWSDIVHGVPCYCLRCEEAFGRPLPRSPQDKGWLDFLHWHRSMISAYLVLTRGTVKALRPDVAFILNHYGSIYVDARMGLAPEHFDASDCSSTEGYAEWHGLLYPAFASEYLASVSPDRPSEVLVSRFASTWDYSLKPVAQMRHEAFSAAARGAAVCFDDEPYRDGRLEPVVYDRIREVFAEMETREPWTELDRYEIDAAVYVSQTSRELATVLDGSRPWGHLQFPPLELNSGPSDVVPAVMGTYKALVEAQLAVGIATGPVPGIPEGGPRVLCLPGVLAIDDTEAEWIERFVAGGGGLVATGPTSLYDTDGRRRTSLRLVDLFGADIDESGELAEYTYVQETGPQARPIPQYLSTLDIRTTDPQAQVAAGRRRPVIDTNGALYFHNNQAAPWTALESPAIVRRKHGQGRVVFAAGSPDGNVARLGSEDHARMLVEAVRWAAGREPLIRTDGPTATRVVAGWLGDDLVVHLVTAAPDLTVRHGSDRTLETITRTPAHRHVRVHISLPISGATLEPNGSELPVDRDASGNSVLLERLGDWETIRFSVA